MVFVNCLVENPHFDSQSKDNLTSVQSVTLEDCKLSPKFLKEIIHRLDLVEDILADISMREKRKLMKAVTSKATRNSVSNNIILDTAVTVIIVIITTIIYHANNTLTSQVLHQSNLTTTDCGCTETSRRTLSRILQVHGLHARTYRGGLCDGLGCCRARGRRQTGARI